MIQNQLSHQMKDNWLCKWTTVESVHSIYDLDCKIVFELIQFLIGIRQNHHATKAGHDKWERQTYLD